MTQKNQWVFSPVSPIQGRPENNHLGLENPVIVVASQVVKKDSVCTLPAHSSKAVGTFTRRFDRSNTNKKR